MLSNRFFQAVSYLPTIAFSAIVARSRTQDKLTQVSQITQLLDICNQKEEWHDLTPQALSEKMQEMQDALLKLTPHISEEVIEQIQTKIEDLSRHLSITTLAQAYCPTPEDFKNAQGLTTKNAAIYVALGYPLLLASEFLLTSTISKCKKFLPYGLDNKIDRLIANNIADRGELYNMLWRTVTIACALNLGMYRAEQLSDNSSMGHCYTRHPGVNTSDCHDEEFWQAFAKGMMEGITYFAGLGILPKLTIVSSCLGSIVNCCKKLLGSDHVANEENSDGASSSYCC